MAESTSGGRGELVDAFGARYPLPFRVLVLSFLTVLSFGINLFALSQAGPRIDTARVLDVRVNAGSATSPHVHPSRLFPPLMALASAGLLFAVCSWALFFAATGADPETMARYRAFPALVSLTVVAAVFAPWNVLYRAQRYHFLRAMRRIAFSGLWSAVPFSDIILADILTSCAKLIADTWVSACIVALRTEQFGVAALGRVGGDKRVYGGGSGCKREWMVPLLTSLPYLFRFRQCLSEVITRSTPTPRRSLLNALKYASAFPVIVISAMQTVYGDPFEADSAFIDDSASSQEPRYWTRETLWRAWIVAVVVNSLYSFWWDVTNDWGLSLLTRAGWDASPAISLAFVGSKPGAVPPPPRSAATPDIVLDQPPPPSRPESPITLTPEKPEDAEPAYPPATTPRTADHPPYASGASAYSTASAPNVRWPFLRPILLFPHPALYYLAIALDLVLRCTWSLRLSPHLHAANEGERGVFVSEALEVFRRFVWVFLRIEWEAVRKGAGSSVASAVQTPAVRHPPRPQPAASSSSTSSRRAGGGGDDDESYANGLPRDEIGLGILVKR